MPLLRLLRLLRGVARCPLRLLELLVQLLLLLLLLWLQLLLLRRLPLQLLLRVRRRQAAVASGRACCSTPASPR